MKIIVKRYFSWKAHCFSVLKRILGQFHYFENFNAHKCDLAKTCSAWPEKSVCVQVFCFPFLERILWRFFMEGAQKMILRFDGEKRAAAHDLKRAFCTIVIKSALFFRFGENLRPVWRFWELSRSKMRFGQNVLRMTWKERFVQFLWKAHFFSRFEENFSQFDDFENFDGQKCDLAKTCCAWPEKSVLYNCYQKRTVFPIWGEFKASLTILRTLTLKNAIWPKRAAHDLKRAFCTIFI